MTVGVLQLQPTASKKIILINSLSSVLRHLVNISVVVWLTQYLLRRLGPEEYSLYPVVMAVMVFMPLFTMFLTEGLARYVTEAYARGDHRRVTQIVSTMFPLLLLAATVILAGGSAFAWHIGSFLRIPNGRLAEARTMMGLLIFMVAVQLPLSVFQLGWFVRQKFLIDNVIGLGQELLRLAVLAVCLFGISTRVLWVTVATVTASIVGLLARVLVSRLLLPSLKFRAREFRWDIARAVIHFGGWRMLGQVSQLVRYGLVPLFLNNMTTPLDVTCYDIGSKAALYIMGFSSVLFGPLVPAMTALHATNQAERIRNAYLRVGRYAMWMILFVTIPLIIYAHDVVRLYVGSAYLLAAPVMALLLFGPILFAPNAAIESLVQATAGVRVVAVRLCCLHFGTLVLTYYLIRWRHAGALGCALAQLLVMLVGQPLLLWPVGRRLAGTTLAQWFRDVVIHGAMPALAGAAIWGAMLLVYPVGNWWDLAVRFLVGGCGYVLVLWFCLASVDHADIRTIRMRISCYLLPQKSQSAQIPTPADPTQAKRA